MTIAVTGYGRDQDRRQALEAGCDQHFLKPVGPKALRSLISVSNDGRESFIRERPPLPAVTPAMLVARREVEIVNTLGLHLRAAGKFVEFARAFQADVAVICDGRKVSGKSILDLATLAAECGTRLVLDVEGPDAEAAVDALAGLVVRRFDEE